MYEKIYTWNPVSFGTRMALLLTQKTKTPCHGVNRVGESSLVTSMANVWGACLAARVPKVNIHLTSKGSTTPKPKKLKMIL